MAYLIFDYDGTLHDTMPVYAPAIRRTYATMVANGLAPLRNLTDQQISSWIGLTVEEMWSSFAPDLPPQVQAQCAADVGLNEQQLIESGGAQLFPGTVETLQQLKDAGHTLIFLSNCDHGYMLAHQRAFDLPRYFDGFFCSGDYDGIPKPQIFAQAIEPEFGSKQTVDYVMIGDRQHDMQVALEHGFRSIGCLYGYCKPGELDCATERVEDITEIPAVLQRWGL